MLPQLGLTGTGLSQSLEWSLFTPGAELVWANIVKHPALQCVSNVCQQKYSYTYPSAAIYIYLKKKKKKAILLCSCTPAHTYMNKLTQPWKQQLRIKTNSFIWEEKNVHQWNCICLFSAFVFRMIRFVGQVKSHISMPCFTEEENRHPSGCWAISLLGHEVGLQPSLGNRLTESQGEVL